jgi:hypothetical protein
LPSPILPPPSISPFLRPLSNLTLDDRNSSSPQPLPALSPPMLATPTNFSLSHRLSVDNGDLRPHRVSDILNPSSAAQQPKYSTSLPPISTITNFLPKSFRRYSD